MQSLAAKLIIPNVLIRNELALAQEIDLLCVCFGFCFFKVQVRLVVGMLGALPSVEQAFDGEQLNAREFLRGHAFVETTEAASLTMAAVGRSREERDLRFLALADVIERAHIIRLDPTTFHAHRDFAAFDC